MWTRIGCLGSDPFKGPTLSNLVSWEIREIGERREINRLRDDKVSKY